MNFSEEVKNELISVKENSLDEERALLSAFVRTSGVIGLKGGVAGFEITADEAIADSFRDVARELYGLSEETLFSKNGRKRYSFMGGGSDDALADMKIITAKGDGIDLNIDLSWDILGADEEKIAYVKGAFLGCGSVTVPSLSGETTTGYHLEFVFSNYQTATDFCELLSELYFLPKNIVRKESYIVYLNTIDEIAALLEMTGAETSAAKLIGISAEKDANNVSNRQINCEVSNMAKQMDASARQILAIRKIDEAIGLDALPTNLKAVAKARVENKNDAMATLADKLGITKSCLNHRLRKIIEISENL